MAFKSVQSLLKSATETSNLDTLPGKLNQVINELNNQTQINPLLRNDLISLIHATINLCEAACDETYHVDTVVTNVSIIMATASGILGHVNFNRPSIYGYGIELQDDKSLLASLYMSEAEAEAEIATFKRIGAAINLKVVPIRITSQMVNRPIPQTFTQAETFPSRDAALDSLVNQPGEIVRNFDNSPAPAQNTHIVTGMSNDHPISTSVNLDTFPTSLQVKPDPTT